MASESVILFYDADCMLCSRSVRFIILHDKRNLFRFSALNSNHARIKGISVEVHSNGSVVLAHGDEILTRSDAVFRVFILLGGWFRYFSIFRLLPRPVRDGLYDWIAQNRYRWFGRRETCLVPGANEKHLFLD